MSDDVLIRAESVGKRFSRQAQKTRQALGRDLAHLLLGGRPPDRSRDDPSEFWALKDVSFSVRRGEALAVIGHNGAGKTTLLRLLNGELNADQGRVALKGNRTSLIDLTGGFANTMTGRENIYYRGAHLGFSRSFLRNKEQEILEFAELGEFIDAPIRTYSSGMLLRLGFAVTVFAEPDILLVDEILSVGDFLFRQKCMNKINQIRSNCAIVLVTHGMSTVTTFADSALVLDRGQEAFSGAPEPAVKAYYRLEAEKQQLGERLSRSTPSMALSASAPNESAGGNTPAAVKKNAANKGAGVSSAGDKEEAAGKDAVVSLARTAADRATEIGPAASGSEQGEAPKRLRIASGGAIDPETLPARARAVMLSFLNNEEAIAGVVHRWLDAGGKVTTQLNGAEPARLHISFVARCAIERLVVGVPIWSAEGAYVTAFGTHGRTINQHVAPGRHWIELKIPKLSLNRGVYYPVITILDGQEFLYRLPAEPLDVILSPEPMFWGLVTIDYEWEQSPSSVPRSAAAG